jgi:hypothetical protein
MNKIKLSHVCTLREGDFFLSDCLEEITRFFFNIILIKDKFIEDR